ncbi:hypothetical protein [Stenotrophomonas lactitubi]|uniref:hypothetical protein n=1 Tax=Stenotrophomonas lactitubi TaxID=2045214 RepID=UPI001DC439D6|nr:hypothetical protein [Stenotrophomonas lactitubi]CAH0244491.1 hypothetical protein SRABI35_02791 [Stenotrophomonas lactitubi]
MTSIVRNNLLTREEYTPYCGEVRCTAGMPRTTGDGEQFRCRCGWRSSFPANFIAVYKATWPQLRAALATN